MYNNNRKALKRHAFTINRIAKLMRNKNLSLKELILLHKEFVRVTADIDLIIAEELYDDRT